MPDVIGITETKLISGQTHTKIDINGYTFLHHDTTTKAGGVAFYIKKTLDFQLINNVSIGINSVEDLWIEIHTKSKPILIGVIYRHPINLKPELESFSTQSFNILTEFNSKNKSFYVLGDFNINLMQTNNNFVESYLNIF